MGYQDALGLAVRRLAQLSPEAVCERCGARYEGGEYFLPWLNSERSVCNAPEAHQILWLHYLAADGVKEPVGRLTAYREMAPALFYESRFDQRAVKPLTDYFGKRPNKMIEVIKSLGGREAVFGSASATVDVLPYLPVTFIIWEGDEELPPDGNILFDQGAKSWLVPEDLAVLASLAVYELIGTEKKRSEFSE